MDIERIVDRTVPWLVLALVPLIVLEFFVDPTSVLGMFIDVFDWLVIVVLVVDLGFKARHATSMKGFLSGHWIEIVSLFPVFVVLRIFEELSLIIEVGDAVQEVGGEVVTVEQQASRSARSTSLFRRFVRPLARFPRFLRASRFYEHPGERGAL